MSGPCLSSSVADHPLRPARDRRLGEPLPHQLANPTWAYPDARGPKVPLFEPKLLCGISHRFQWLSPTSGQFPRHYSPVRRSTPLSFPEGSDNSFPLDLHVLGLPPAFNLSHDQTLQFKINAILTRCPKATKADQTWLKVQTNLKDVNIFLVRLP